MVETQYLLRLFFYFIFIVCVRFFFLIQKEMFKAVITDPVPAT